jgi:dihydrolipoamide dehydrogenase
MQNPYDLIIIGGGPGGYESAFRAAEAGLKTLLVEEQGIGGTCLNRGCIPTKTLMHASELYREAGRFEEFGLAAQAVAFDMAKMQERKTQVVNNLQSGIRQQLKSHKVEVLQGHGMILGSGRVRVTLAAEGETAAEEKVLETARILIATGAVPAKPPIPGLELPGVFTSDDLLDSDAGKQVYDPLIIIGGGVIGVEMATIYNALGCQVTLLEALPRLLPAMDREISQNLSMILKKRGVQVFAGAKVTRVAQEEGGLVCHFEYKEAPQSLPAAGILVAIGRKPYTGGLFAPGVEPAVERGALVVDRDFQTSIPGIYAAGDVIGGIQLAHAAAAEGIAAVEGMAGLAPGISLKAVPGCVYTNPEIASVGMTEDEAKAACIAVIAGKSLMSANGKSVIENQDRGFIKLVFDKETEVLLGAQLMCARATDLISELTTALVNGLTRAQLAAVIRPHPTFSEAVTQAAEAASK